MKYILDVDASKVIEAVRSTGVTITPAMMHYAHYLISNMKNIGTWQLSNAVYGFVGATADSHKWNWKDLRDTDAAFRLTYPNGMTNDSFGITGNGTNQYANTFLIPSTASGMTSSSNHLSCYVTKNIGDGNARYVFGAGSFAGSNILAMYLRKTTIQAYLASNPSTIDAKVYTNNIAELKGYYIGNNLSNALTIKKNGIELTNNTSNLSDGFSGLPNFSLAIMCLQQSAGGFSNFDNKSLGMASIGSGLTDTQALQQSQIVTNAQAILNRA